MVSPREPVEHEFALLTPHPGSVASYRRVAAESLITIQVEEITLTMLDKVINSVRTLDVL